MLKPNVFSFEFRFDRVFFGVVIFYVRFLIIMCIGNQIYYFCEGNSSDLYLNTVKHTDSSINVVKFHINYTFNIN